jgi:hypothetical protein
MSNNPNDSIDSNTNSDANLSENSSLVESKVTNVPEKSNQSPKDYDGHPKNTPPDNPLNTITLQCNSDES